MPGKKRRSNRKAKDSVFTNLFTIPKYRYQLFKELRKEVVDTMTQLYDREREMRLYVEEMKQDAAKKSTLDAIKKLMKKLKMSAKEAMDFLEIAPKDQKTYLPMLKKG